MAGNQLFERQLRHFSPHTYNALTKLVMAMAAVTKNTGKKTLFGRDKGQESYSKFLEALKVSLQAMILDRLIQESTSSEEAVSILVGKLKEFELAHPNSVSGAPFNQSIKFVPGLTAVHRTPLSGRRLLLALGLQR